jgi:hypothetical protein
VEDISVFTFAGIRSGFFHSPDHSTYGPYNRRLIEEIAALDKAFSTHGLQSSLTGEILLSEVIRAQCLQCGVPSENIASDAVDTRADDDYWSHTCGDSERNGVFVFHH